MVTEASILVLQYLYVSRMILCILLVRCANKKQTTVTMMTQYVRNDPKAKPGDFKII